MMQPRPLTSLPTDVVSTGDPQLDYVLRGGLPCGSLTEVVGEAGASKTQLCLQLLLTVQLPQAYGGLSGSAVYVYTEGSPATQRLQQLATALPLRYPPEALQGLPDPTANVFVERGVCSGGDLLRRLQRLRGLLDQQRRRAQAAVGAGTVGGANQQHCALTTTTSSGSGSSPGCRPVRLLVVDSVAHVFRDLGAGGPGGSGGAVELTGRTELLFKISALLRQYADEYGLAVLLVNQVVDKFEPRPRSAATAAMQQPQQARQGWRGGGARSTGHTGGLQLESMGREVVPALGLAWANCISTRLLLSRCPAPFGAGGPALFFGPPAFAAPASAQAGGQQGGGGVMAPALRRLQVVFAPHLARGRQCHYVVEAWGVRGLHPDELQQHDVAAAQAAQQQQEAAAAAAAEAQRQQLAWEQQQAWQQQLEWEEQQQQKWQQQPPQQQQQKWQQQPPQQQQMWAAHPPLQEQAWQPGQGHQAQQQQQEQHGGTQAFQPQQQQQHQQQQQQCGAQTYHPQRPQQHGGDQAFQPQQQLRQPLQERQASDW
ncbi:hypothetical protein D9Q98_006241 [Chlorella vulgaris]|uniref:RecA family profile 1 domain-containing protein n=1 Tax=Chlorella vulgaris TaxID=3077 RepID=A0A9D4Z160_CHLVU|nr:hypothetical protein D9Q98_006241 [Chlorella vulgaris]